jgi:hypothetical protein
MDPQIESLTGSPMIDALAADGPLAEHAAKLRLFGRLVGSWHIVGRFFDEAGNVTRERRGEWHFGWVLEGRAIQDVLISPPRDEREDGEPSHEYGTTIRVYDPRIDGWRVTFISPLFGATVNLIAREHGAEIWLEGRAPDSRLYRWTFSDITTESARWQGFTSSDEGLTWLRDEEILLSRWFTESAGVNEDGGNSR